MTRRHDPRRQKQRVRKFDPRTGRLTATQWFKLEEYCDPQKIQRVPIQNVHGNVFVHGRIRDLILVEVPESASEKEREEVAAFIEKTFGLPGLVVHGGIRFLKLRPCTREEEQVLDGVPTKEASASPAEPSGQDPGGGPEPDGDGHRGG